MSITGKESMWGTINLTQGQLDLINDSPTLVSEINAYQAAVDNGTAQPINSSIGAFNTDLGLLQTINVSTTTQSRLEIQMGAAVIGEEPADFVGDLSYELGHFMSYQNDLSLYTNAQNPMVDMVNATNPNGSSYDAVDGTIGVVSEAESEANNYVVQQHILSSTNGQTQIKLNGNSNSGGALQTTLDSAYATDKAKGVNADQDEDTLIQDAKNVTGSISIGIPGNPGLNFFDYYATNPAGMLQYFYGIPVSQSKSGLQGTQPVDPSTNVSINYDPGTNSLISSTIDYASGNSETLDFSSSRLSSVIYIGIDGGITATISYTYNAAGQLMTGTTLNAAGQQTEQVRFNADGSQVQDFYNPSTGALTGENQIAADGSQTDYVLNADGSQTATALNASGQKTEQV